MRWTDFFSHLEHDFALDAHDPPESGVQGDTIDSHFMDVCARAKASGREVAVGMVTGDVFHVSPRAVSREWFSGLVGGEKGSGVVIPLQALVWVEGDTVKVRDEKLPLVTATLTDVLSDMARRHARVTIRTRHSDIAGVITGVGEGFVDVVAQRASRPGVNLRVPCHAMVAVFQGITNWG